MSHICTIFATKRKMSEEDKKLYFISFCIEKYKSSHNMEGAKVADLFEKKGVTDYLENNYDVLHTQGADWLVSDIDEYLRR